MPREHNRHFSGAMDEVSWKVQNASTYPTLLSEEWMEMRRETSEGVTSAGPWRTDNGGLRREGTHPLPVEHGRSVHATRET